MSKAFSLFSIVALAALGLTTPLLAQERSAVSSVEMDAAVSARPAGTRQAANGVRVTANAAVDQPSQDGDRVLAGGSVVITSTIVIIALLVIILLIVA
jgi:hypothetical protein